LPATFMRPPRRQPKVGGVAQPRRCPYYSTVWLNYNIQPSG
jgi:hypothetical protein